MSRAAMVARARCSALVTEATLVPRRSAASLALQRSTSHRMSAARWTGDRCRIAAASASLDRLAPGGDLGRIVRRRRGRVEGRPDRVRLGPGPQHVAADVGRDPVEPRSQHGTALQAVEASPRAHQRVLHGVLGIEGRAEHPATVSGELRAVLLEDARGGEAGAHRRAVTGSAHAPAAAARRAKSPKSVASRPRARRTPSAVATLRPSSTSPKR